MSIRFLSFLAVAALLLAGCGALPSFTALTGSGNPVTQTFDFAGFDSLEIGNAFQAEIVASDNFSVEVTVDDNLIDYLRVEQQGDTVKIGLDPNTAATRADLRARITMPALVNLDASGATRANVSGFKSSANTSVTASGASTVRGDMETGDMTVDASGASTVNLSGSGDSLRATASGASTADLSNFTVSNADVDANGASRINVAASGKLDAKASGASTVRYSGNPTLGRIDESGASNVTAQ
ncbi:MAG: head GIN domain-containing protein [Caldilineales bacterium]